MSISNGVDANEVNFNAAFLSRTVDTTAVGKVTLNKPSEGSQVTSVQLAINELEDTVGQVGEGDATRKNYSSNNVVANGDNRKVAIGKLDAEFDPATGHTHDGTAGSGGPVPIGSTTGTLAIARGGTGQVTANAALNALLPSQGGNAGKFLQTNGTDASWAADASSRSGKQAITNASDTVSVVYSSAFPDTTHSVVFSVLNVTDSDPIFLIGVVSAQSTTGFTVKLNAPADSANYVLSWFARSAV